MQWCIPIRCTPQLSLSFENPFPWSVSRLGVNSLNVPVAEYALPGTSDLAISAELALRSNPGVQAILLPNHGLVTIGAALEDAFSLAINVEREAQILAIASSLGTPVQLTASQLSQINATYAAMHAKTA